LHIRIPAHRELRLSKQWPSMVKDARALSLIYRDLALEAAPSSAHVLLQDLAGEDKLTRVYTMVSRSAHQYYEKTIF
jgi:hypothetical protein